MKLSYWLKSVGCKNLDVPVLQKGFTRFASFDHIFCITMIGCDHIYASHLFYRIQYYLQKLNEWVTSHERERERVEDFDLNGLICSLASNHSSFDVTGVPHHVTVWQINPNLKKSIQLIYKLQKTKWIYYECYIFYTWSNLPLRIASLALSAISTAFILGWTLNVIPTSLGISTYSSFVASKYPDRLPFQKNVTWPNLTVSLH